MKPIPKAYEELIGNLIAEGHLRTPLVIEAFRNIDRADFVPENLKHAAYLNEPLPIGFGQTISQPLTVAFMLELLDPRPGDKILDVGAGSGWQAALLAYIVSRDEGRLLKKFTKPSGKIVAIERIPGLKIIAATNLRKYDFVGKGIVKVILGNATEGCRGEAPFDKVIAAASSPEAIPVAWKEEVVVGGRVVAPCGNAVQCLNKVSSSDFNIQEYAGFSFVPLVYDEGG